MSVLYKALSRANKQGGPESGGDEPPPPFAPKPPKGRSPVVMAALGVAALAVLGGGGYLGYTMMSGGDDSVANWTPPPANPTPANPAPANPAPAPAPGTAPAPAAMAPAPGTAPAAAPPAGAPPAGASPAAPTQMAQAPAGAPPAPPAGLAPPAAAPAPGALPVGAVPPAGAVPGALPPAPPGTMPTAAPGKLPPGALPPGAAPSAAGAITAADGSAAPQPVPAESEKAAEKPQRAWVEKKPGSASGFRVAVGGGSPSAPPKAEPAPRVNASIPAGDGLYARALNQTREGQIEAAMTTYETLLRQQPRHGDAKTNWIALLNQIPPDAAIGRMLTVYDRNRDPQIAAEIGITFAKMKDFERATRFLQTAAAGLPADASIAYNLAVVQDTAGNRAAAVSSYQRALSLPGFADTGIPASSVRTRMSFLSAGS